VKLNRLRRRGGGAVAGPGGGATGGFGGRGMGVPIGGGGIVVTLILLAVILLPRLLGGGTGALSPFGDQGPVPPGRSIEPGDTMGEFVDAVTDDVQTTWATEFRRAGLTYKDTEVVLFQGTTPTGCGQATPEVGPFYCPADGRVYLERGFFRELEQRFGASGDFAEAYVIAHEIGHHVQDLLGIEADVRRQAEADPSRANDLSIRLELQADCFAGVWGRAAQGAGILEPGDLEEGITAAAAVGDDRIQKAATGRIDPETWTHGSSQQRVDWFRTGFQVGNPDACDTFANDV
jgi:predicted metalloprotease